MDCSVGKYLAAGSGAVEWGVLVEVVVVEDAVVVAA